MFKLTSVLITRGLDEHLCPQAHIEMESSVSVLTNNVAAVMQSLHSLAYQQWCTPLAHKQGGNFMPWRATEHVLDVQNVLHLVQPLWLRPYFPPRARVRYSPVKRRMSVPFPLGYEPMPLRIALADVGGNNPLRVYRMSIEPPLYFVWGNGAPIFIHVAALLTYEALPYLKESNYVDN